MADFLAGGSWRHVAELIEVESGARDAQPRLAEALALCRLHGATLVIAKLDHLSRDAAGNEVRGSKNCSIRIRAAYGTTGGWAQLVRLQDPWLPLAERAK